MVYNRVLLCVNNNSSGQRAFDYYLKNVHKAENELIVLHVSGLVYPTVHAENGPTEANGTEAAAEEVKRRNAALMRKYERKCVDARVPYECVVTQPGKSGTAATIVEEARQRKADLIVIGCRNICSNLCAMLKRFSGSVSDYLVNKSDIPVLVLPGGDQ